MMVEGTCRHAVRFRERSSFAQATDMGAKQKSFGLMPFILTIIFAAYVVNLLAAMLTGRRIQQVR
jgi:hypothetical protein